MTHDTKDDLVPQTKLVSLFLRPRCLNRKAGGDKFKPNNRSFIPCHTCSLENLKTERLQQEVLEMIGCEFIHLELPQIMP